MGFGSFLLDVGKSIYGAAVDKSDRLNQLKSEHQRYNDNDLKRKFKTSSGETKLVIASILKDRGYGNKT